MSGHTTKTVALISVIFFVSAVSAYGYAVLMTAQMGQVLRSHFETIANTNAKTQVYYDLMKTFEASTQTRAELGAFVLTEGEAGDFLTEIEKVGTTQRVAITTHALKVEKKKDTPDVLAIQFGIEGEEENVRHVITLFETLPYPSSIEALSLVRNIEGITKATIDVQIILVTYDR